MKSLGIDIGSSSVKVSLLDIPTGECVASATNPAAEMPIEALRSGWAEQDPEMWWHYVREGIRQIAVKHPMREVAQQAQRAHDAPGQQYSAHTGQHTLAEIHIQEAGGQGAGPLLLFPSIFL